MNRPTDNNFKKNWEEVYKERKKIDHLTDARIQKGIERKINSTVSFKKWYWVAALFLIFSGIGTLFYFDSSGVSNQHKKETTFSNTFASYNYNKRISLPDGSIIIMQPNSKLVLARDFNKKNRRILFNGKATFDIAKDKTKPFIIDAKKFTVQVLGTKFFLDQTKGKQKVELFEGKVKINHQGKVTYLLPNEVWNQNTETITKKYLAADSQRDFSFNEESFGNIITELEEVYHVEINYPEKLRKKTIKGSFSGNLNEVLSALSYPFNLNVENISINKINLKEKHR